MTTCLIGRDGGLTLVFDTYLHASHVNLAMPRTNNINRVCTHRNTVQRTAQLLGRCKFLVQLFCTLPSWLKHDCAISSLMCIIEFHLQQQRVPSVKQLVFSCANAARVIYASRTSEAVHSPAAMRSTICEASILGIGKVIRLSLETMKWRWGTAACYTPVALKKSCWDSDASLETSERRRARSARFSVTMAVLEAENGHICDNEQCQDWRKVVDDGPWQSGK